MIQFPKNNGHFNVLHTLLLNLLIIFRYNTPWLRMWKLTEKSFQEYHHHPWSMTTLIIKTSGCRHWQPVSSSQMIFFSSFNSVACLMNVAFDAGTMYLKKWLLGSTQVAKKCLEVVIYFRVLYWSHETIWKIKNLFR